MYTELMGSFRRSPPLCAVLQGLAVWSVVVVGGEWSVSVPKRVSTLAGSCVVIPCSFTSTTSAVDVSWYQYVSRGYPLVYSRSHPDSVIDKFRGKTELSGSKERGDCSLKIYPAQAAQNAEQIYVWVEPNQLQGSYFYDQTVTLEVTEHAAQPEIRVSEGKALLASSTVSLAEGATAVLSCSVSHGCPPQPPTLSFFARGGPVAGRVTQSRTGEATVTLERSWTAAAEHNGRSLACEVTHHGGASASREVVLQVLYAPKSVSIHGDHTVVGRVSLSCRSQANPPAVWYRWYRVNQGQLTLLGHTSETALITELDRNQNLFRCEASNTAGRGSSPDFEVINEYKPSISEASQCTFDSGSLRCWCEASARPLATLRWEVDGAPRPGRASVREGDVVKAAWSRVGKDAKETTRVTCISSNLHGQDRRQLRIRVKALPANVTVTQSPARQLEGAGVTLTCTGQGSPPVSGYRWFQGPEGQEASLEGGSRDLRVAAVTRDSGPYRCSARNEVGEASSPVTGLNVEYAPHILPASSCTLGNGPIRCECVVDSNPTAKVTWSSMGSPTNEKHNISSTLSGRFLRSILTGPMGDEGPHVYCNATNQHGDAFYQLQLPSTEGHSAMTFGTIAGALALCLLLGAIFFCKRMKRQRKHTPSTVLSQKEVKRVVRKEVKTDSFYENTKYRDHLLSHLVPVIEPVQRWSYRTPDGAKGAQ
ncbi:hypothetical protein COCON_G00018510 [Conger conger]|uniref:Ig-like domain-containing protein n=1 Tax=Conger conger TaxID=82655 RepID=A0A9Q1E3W3_CONCO|nr:hypothetical protein COCON_G00018510 [Conger conger]